MILRPYQKEDAATICSWIRTEDELFRWSADRFNKFPLQASDINQNYAEQLAGGRFFPLTAVDEEGHIAGHFIIRYPREKDDSTVRFGFVIVDPTIRGKGYGKEMLLQGVRYVREHNLAPRIDLGVFANNDSARHCYEAVGFKEYRRRMSELPIGTWECIDMELVDPIEIRIIDAANQQDINIPNQPFPLFGRMLPSYQDGKWSCTEEAFPEVTEMCFPDEHYDYDAMAENSIFLGAYDHGTCVIAHSS